MTTKYPFLLCFGLCTFHAQIASAGPYKCRPMTSDGIDHSGKALVRTLVACPGEVEVEIHWVDEKVGTNSGPVIRMHPNFTRVVRESSNWVWKSTEEPRHFRHIPRRPNPRRRGYGTDPCASNFIHIYKGAQLTEPPAPWLKKEGRVRVTVGSELYISVDSDMTRFYRFLEAAQKSTCKDADLEFGHLCSVLADMPPAGPPVPSLYDETFGYDGYGPGPTDWNGADSCGGSATKKGDKVPLVCGPYRQGLKKTKVDEMLESAPTVFEWRLSYLENFDPSRQILIGSDTHYRRSLVRGTTICER